MAKILLVEDDRVMALTIITAMEGQQHTVEHVVEGKEALMMLMLTSYDLVILDWALPDLQGIDVLAQMRQRRDSTPVIMLTARELEQDKERGLDAGADDYVTKPFSLKELAARVRALLRRSSGNATNLITAGLLSLDMQTHELRKEDVRIALLPMEFALIEFLMRNPGEVFSADALLERVWHSHSESSVEAVRTCIKRLRQKLDSEDTPVSQSVIETIPKVGYRLRA
ncbi:MAG: response regulator transcription factor [Cyanobacteria bacterium HKST-UBA02]|nr:response regulator transcription factor [Cyanobacteria bacterium HKST-UBA02]